MKRKIPAKCTDCACDLFISKEKNSFIYFKGKYYCNDCFFNVGD